MESFDDGKSVTSFEDICSILADLWINYRSDEQFSDFVEYNDLGLPLSFCIDSNLVEPKQLAQQYVTETWQIFLLALGIKEDIGWSTLQDVLRYAEENGETD